MNKRTQNILLTIVALCFIAAALIMLGISIFGGNKAYLTPALAATCVANLINVYRSRINRDK